MKRYVLGLAMVLGAAANANAQQAAEQAQAKIDKDDPGIIAVLAVDNCFTSGSGETFLKVCITENGNISWLESPAGKRHINTREGYAVCSYDTSMVVHGFDVNTAAEGWGPSIVSDNKRVITRTSLDGLIQLKQTFTVLPAYRGVDVKMEVKNLSPVTIPTIVIQRYFDGDVDGQLENTVYHFGQAVGLTWSNMLLLSASPVVAQFFKSAVPFSSWDPLGAGLKWARGCEAPLTASGATGDYVAGLRAAFNNVKAGQTKTLTLNYRRY